MTAETAPTPAELARYAVSSWSKVIHGSGDRHDWALQCAALMEQHGVDVELPRYPRARFAGVAQTRDETVRRIYRNALATAQASQP